MESWAYHTFEPLPARREKARLTAARLLRQSASASFGSSRFAGSVPRAFLEGVFYHYQDDQPRAKMMFEQARVVAERLVNESPDDAPRRAMLGQILAALGQKEAAIAEGKRAAELLPESEDAFGGPSISTALAQIYVWTGDYDQAFRLLDHLLETPNGLTVPFLKLDPAWDPLRKDARFQALIDKHGGKT